MLSFIIIVVVFPLSFTWVKGCAITIKQLLPDFALCKDISKTKL